MSSIFEMNLLPGRRELLWLSISLKNSRNDALFIELFASVRVPRVSEYLMTNSIVAGLIDDI